MRQRVLDHIRDHALAWVTVHPITRALPSLERLRATEWDAWFETLMRNRLVMGAIRYARMWDPDRPDYDYVRSIREKLESWLRTGNLECWVDIANLAMLAFRHARHPEKHFGALDDKEHTEIIGT